MHFLLKNKYILLNNTTITVMNVFFPLTFQSPTAATAPHHPALICIGIRNALNDAVSTVPSRNRWLSGWSLSKYKFPTCSKLGTNQWHSAAVQFTVERTCGFASKIWISGKKCRLIDSCITFDDRSFTELVMDKQSLNLRSCWSHFSMTMHLI